jgi:hypothetical protein
MIIGHQYELQDVKTESGHVLLKAGIVRLLDILPRSIEPDPDKVALYYRYEDRKSKAFLGAAMAFKEDRYVLERVDPIGKTAILLSKFTRFIGEMGGAKRAETCVHYDSAESLLADLAISQLFRDAKGNEFQIYGIEKNHELDLRVSVTLSYKSVGRETGEAIWSQGHPIDINMFAACVVKNRTARIG